MGRHKGTEKHRLHQNLMNRLDTLYIMFPSNHPLKVQEAHTKWEIPEEVKRAIWSEVEGVIITAYQSGHKKGYEKGLVDGAIAAATKNNAENTNEKKA